MKSLLLNGLLVAYLFFCIVTVQAQSWVPLVSGTNRHLRDVYFQDRNTGWAVGDSGTILHTTDGGSNWSWQNSPVSTNLISMAFHNADTGIILTEFSYFIRTDNGGQTWYPDTTNQLGICFGKRVRIQDGIAYFTSQGCFGGTWLHKLNLQTGDTSEVFNYWQPQGSSFEYPIFNDVGFPTNGDIFALGLDSVHASSSNQGDTWAITPPQDTLFDWLAVDFTPDGVGNAITNDLFWPLYKTNDHGASWHRDTTWMSTFFYPTCTDLDFLTGTYGVVTTDIQWATQGLIVEVLPNQQFPNLITTDNVARAVYMVDDSVGYVVGDSGMILKRGGGALGIIAPPITDELVIFPNPSHQNAQILWQGEPAELEVISLEGKILHRQDILKGISPLDVGGLAKGVYFVRVKSASGVYCQKLMIDGE